MLDTRIESARSARADSVGWMKERDSPRRAATGRALQLPREQTQRLILARPLSQSCAGSPSTPRLPRGLRLHGPTGTPSYWMLIDAYEVSHSKSSGYSIVVSTYRCGLLVNHNNSDETPVRFRLATLFCSGLDHSFLAVTKVVCQVKNSLCPSPVRSIGPRRHGAMTPWRTRAACASFPKAG